MNNKNNKSKFEEWFENFNKINSGAEDKDTAELAWRGCKNEILNLLEQNKELEAISHDGKKVYKIYGNVIEKIEKL